MPRRPKGLGTLYLSKDGRYVGALYMRRTDGTTKRSVIHGKTRAEAEQKLSTLVAQRDKGIPAPSESWTIAAFLDHWLTDVLPQRVRPRTLEWYESTVRLHIKPTLGSKRLRSLTVADVQDAIHSLVADGVGPRSIEKMRTALSSALGHAMRKELVFRNVARLVELPKYTRKKVRIWTPDQATAFLAGMRGHRWEAGYLLNLLYGMRRGEVLGLRWRDVDFRTDEFELVHQLQRINGILELGPVKTEAGERSLPLLPALRQVLIETADRNGITLDPHSDPASTPYADNPVIASKAGEYVDPKNYVRTFKLYSDRLGLPEITLHQTRHTVATLLKNLGVPDRDIQAILGHSSVAVTQKFYQQGDHTVQRDGLLKAEAVLANVSRIAVPTTRMTSNDVELSAISHQDGPSNDAQTIIRDTTQVEPAKEKRRSSEVKSASFLGGTSGARTHDTLLKSYPRLTFDTLPTPVIRALHRRTTRHIVGILAIRISHHTVPSPVPSGTNVSDLLAVRNACRSAITERLRRRSFPLNLIPDSTHHDHQEAA